MKSDDAFSVSFSGPAECLSKLEQVQFQYECLLDYMAMYHAKHLPPDFLDSAVEHLHEIADKYELTISI